MIQVFSSAYAGRGSNPLLVIFFSHYPFVVTVADYSTVNVQYSATHSSLHNGVYAPCTEIVLRSARRLDEVWIRWRVRSDLGYMCSPSL